MSGLRLLFGGVLQPGDEGYDEKEGVEELKPVLKESVATVEPSKKNTTPSSNGQCPTPSSTITGLNTLSCFLHTNKLTPILIYLILVLMTLIFIILGAYSKTERPDLYNRTNIATALIMVLMGPVLMLIAGMATSSALAYIMLFGAIATWIVCTFVLMSDLGFF